MIRFDVNHAATTRIKKLAQSWPAFLTATFALMIGCETAADPEAQFDPRMVVYCILSTESDTQYVRLLRSYSVGETDSSNASERDVRDALVSIDGIGPTGHFLFDPVVIANPDTSSEVDSIHLYAAYGFRPTSGYTYRLVVESPTYGIVNVPTQVPFHSNLNIDLAANSILSNPWSSRTSQPTVIFPFGQGAAAYKVRLEIEYEDQTPSGTFIKRFEVPQRLEVVSCIREAYNFVYPPVISPGSTGNRLTYRFDSFAYRRSVELINESAYNHRFLRAIFTVIQFNSEWYRYYRSARTFEDRFSVRLDQPDYSSIPGGLGVFGGFAVDTISTPLREVMINDRPDLWSNCSNDFPG